MTAASKFDWYEKGSRADNDGFVLTEKTARKQSFSTILFTQNTHDTNGIRARKRKAKGAFGLVTCRSDSYATPVGV